MTIVIIEYYRERKELICSADSRISNNTINGCHTRKITDYFQKILPIRLNYYNHLTDEKSGEKVGIQKSFIHELGFAFAGNTLTAQATYGWLLVALNQLSKNSNNKIESLNETIGIESVLELACSRATNMIREVCSLNVGALSGSGTEYMFQAFIFGFCPKKQKMAVGKISPDLTQEVFSMTHQIWYPEDMCDSKTRLIWVIGEGKECAYSLYNDGIQNGSVLNGNEVIRRIISEDEIKSIGGHVMNAISNDKIFIITSLGEHKEIMDNGLSKNPVISYVGEDITDKEVDGFRLSFLALD